MFEDGTEIELCGSFAKFCEIARQVIVFRGENRLILLGIRKYIFRPVIVEGIFGDGESAVVCLICPPEGILLLVIVSEWEACVNIPDLYIIRFDGVEAFCSTYIKTGEHDGSQQVSTTDVKPFFAIPAFVTLAQHFLRKEESRERLSRIKSRKSNVNLRPVASLPLTLDLVRLELRQVILVLSEEFIGHLSNFGKRQNG